MREPELTLAIARRAELYAPERLDRLIAAVEELREHARWVERSHGEELERVAPDQRASACNLLHYLALRHHDLRELQLALAGLGLSSLGRAESCVLFTLDRVCAALCRLAGREPREGEAPVDCVSGPARLREHARRLLGEPRAGRQARIMVTMPSEAADDPALIASLVAAGMDILRINAAHDGPEQWLRMLDHLGPSGRERCLVQLDLAGPKLRTLRRLDRDKASLRLRVGETVELVAKGERHEQSLGAVRGCFSCTLGEALLDVVEGHRLWFDDGKIGCVVERAAGLHLLLRVVRAPLAGAKLRGDKGINLPDSDLRLAGLTEQDLEHLDFAAEHADRIGLSFVRTPEDVRRVVAELARRGRHDGGIVMKIETRQAFENLPFLLLAALEAPPVGVMVARGDLAVEVGFERLAELQEEMLWICEAAHVPVIWATQVLESLAKTGTPSRAEVTDAAMAARAECVMLNKGQHIVEAVRFLGDVLGRMAAHQQKKRSMLRHLHVSDPIWDARPPPGR